MNSVQASTGIFPFQLYLGYNSCLIPFLDGDIIPPANINDLTFHVKALIQQLQSNTALAHNNLHVAKISQTASTNAHRSQDHVFNVGDKVLLSMTHHQQKYMHKGDKCVAKFFICFDGPYKVLQAFLDSFVYTLDLSSHMRIFPIFHLSLL